MLAVAQGFEEGRYQGVVARYLSLAWAEVSARTVVRSLRASGATRIVAVGGSTLGGSGKTPLAIACARELARGGARVALVGHAYRARPGRARIVSTFDPLAEVGDEALVAAHALEAQGVRVTSAELSMEPTQTARPGGDEAEQVLTFLDALEEHEDVQRVYSNADFDEAALEALLT